MNPSEIFTDDPDSYAVVGLAVIGTAVASSRIGSLRLPRDPVLRGRAADLYRGFADELETA